MTDAGPNGDRTSVWARSKKCGAPKRRTGEPCRAVAMANGRCRIHGGTALKGNAVAAFTHGRYSKYLPTELAAAAERALANHDRLDLTEHVALLEALLVRAVQGVAAGGGGDAWKLLDQKRREFHRAAAMPNKDAAGELQVRIITEVWDIVAAEYAATLAAKEARDTVQDIRRLAESERKRRVEDRTMVTVEELVALLGVLGDALSRHVPDAGQRSEVVTVIARYVGEFRTREQRAYATGGVED